MCRLKLCCTVDYIHFDKSNDLFYQLFISKLNFLPRTDDSEESDKRRDDSEDNAKDNQDGGSESADKSPDDVPETSKDGGTEKTISRNHVVLSNGQKSLGMWHFYISTSFRTSFSSKSYTF